MDEAEKRAEVAMPWEAARVFGCADGCIYWDPRDRDDCGRSRCTWYRIYLFPGERPDCPDYR